LVRKMEGSQHFQQTRIQSESAESGSGPTAGDTVRFDITALYVPGSSAPSPPGRKP